MRTRTAVAIISLATLALAACGGDDDDTTSDDAAAEQDDTDTDNAGDADTDTADAAGDEAADAGTEATEPDDDTSSASAGTGSGTATLELSNGESFEFSILCALEPQMSAGSEILFTVVSYDDPGLDVTQFGDEGTVTGIASITVYDADYNTLWGAESIFDAFGGSIELSLDGSTVTGSATFFAGGEPQGETVDGELVANC